MDERAGMAQYEGDRGAEVEENWARSIAKVAELERAVRATTDEVGKSAEEVARLSTELKSRKRASRKVGTEKTAFAEMVDGLRSDAQRQQLLVESLQHEDSAK